MIDKNKHYTTRNGLPVIIYATNSHGDYPVYGEVLDSNGWFDFGWAADGKVFVNQTEDTELDLIEIDCKEE